MNIVLELFTAVITLIGVSCSLNSAQPKDQKTDGGKLFVDAKNGRDIKTCGRSRQSACKSFSKALELVNPGGVVHLIGDYSVTGGTIVKKNVEITTDENDRGRIVDRYRGNINRLADFYAFTALMMVPVKIRISNIQFINANILSVLSSVRANKGANIVLHNVRVIGKCSYNRQSIYIANRQSQHSKAISLKITQSNFAHFRPISLTNLKELLVHNSTFKQEQDEIMVLVNCQKVVISNSIFIDGSPCFKIEMADDNVEISNSSFTGCRSEEGGAIHVRDPAKKVLLNNCHFKENHATKSGGAVYLNLDRLNRDGKNPSTQVKSCKFENNSAGYYGQSIFSNIPIQLETVSILAAEREGATHLHINAEQITLANVNVRTHSQGRLQSSMVRPGISINTDNLTIRGDILYQCPKYFYVKTDYSSYISKQREGMTAFYTTAFSSFTVICLSCSYEKYTVDPSNLTVYPYKITTARKKVTRRWRQKLVNTTKTWRQTLFKEECLQCPPGARCSGDIVPLENFWGYQVKSRKNPITFIMCPLGYCCTGDKCVDYDSCSEGRHGILCSKCLKGYSLSFFSNKCVKKGRKKCNLAAFLFYFKVLSSLYTLLLTFLPLLIEVLKDKCSSSNPSENEMDEDKKTSMSNAGEVPLMVNTRSGHDEKELSRDTTLDGTNAHEVPLMIRTTSGEAENAVNGDTNLDGTNADEVPLMIRSTSGQEKKEVDGDTTLDGASVDAIPLMIRTTSGQEENEVNGDTNLDDTNADEVPLMIRSTSGPENNEVSRYTNLDGANAGEAPIIKNKNEEVSLPYAACFLVVIYFFQVAFLLHVDTPSEDNNLTQMQFLRSVVKSIMNIRLIASQIVCPTNNLNLPIKKFINYGLNVDSMFNLLLLYIIWKVITMIQKFFDCASNEGGEGKPKVSSSFQNTMQTTNVPLRCLAFPSLLKIGFLRLFKLNITSISVLTFQMVHCEDMNGIKHLYLYAEQRCFALWQYLLLFIVVPTILVFPISLHMSLNLLQKRLITTNNFLLALVVPYYAFFLYVKNRSSQDHPMPSPDKEEENCRKAILESEDDPFRTDERYILRWSVWQVYRNILIVVMCTWIINPIYRTTWFIPVFILFILQDRSNKPYKHPHMNALLALSSACWGIIAVCNIPVSLSVMFNVTSVPHMKKILLALEYIEIAMYVVVPASLIVWKMQEKYCTGKKKLL